MCEAVRKNYEAQMNDINLRQRDQQVLLAEATKIVGQAEEQSRLKQAQQDSLQAESKRIMSECKMNLMSLANELCGVKQIRQELYKMEMQRPFIQDCEVSPWTPEECSSPCGGGKQRLTRSVVVPSQLGMACPPLEMEKTCNEQGCPVDCEMGDWGGWSMCSAKCGGGIMQRIRTINTQAEHSGKPCSETVQSVSCNLDSCDHN